MMLRRAFALVAAGSVVFVSACAGGESRETVVVTSVEWVDPDPDAGQDLPEPDVEGSGGDKGSSSSDWQSEYAWVLDHPGDYPVNSAAQYTPDGTYEYALVEANGGGSPELLLAVGGTDVDPVIVFTIGDDGKAHASEDVLLMGAPGNGAGRLAVWASADGAGVYQIAGSAGSRESSSELFRLDGASLRGGAQETFPSDSHLADHMLIDWHPVSDPHPLRAGTPTVFAPSGGASAPESSSQIEFVGNVVRKTGEELMAPRGLGMPNGQSPESEYFLLWLDEPMTVTGTVGGSTDTKEIEFVTLGSREYWPHGPQEYNTHWEDFVGKRMKFTKDADDIAFPSDTSMPLGSTWMGDEATYEVLN